MSVLASRCSAIASTSWCRHRLNSTYSTQVFVNHGRVLPSDGAQKADCLICIGKFFCQDLDLSFEIRNLLGLWVLIFDRFVRNEWGFWCVAQCWEILVHLGITRVQTSHHQRETISSQRLTKQTRQLRVAIRDVALFAFATLGQSRDNLTQCQQTLVDINGLLWRDISRLRLSLTSCEINELQCANNRIVWVLPVDLLESHLEHWVRSATCIVHIMGGNDFVFDSEVVQCEDVFSGSALESVQIFNLKVVLVPL